MCVEYHVCKSRTASPIKGGWGVVGVRDKGKKPIPYNCQKNLTFLAQPQPLQFLFQIPLNLVGCSISLVLCLHPVSEQRNALT